MGFAGFQVGYMGIVIEDLFKTDCGGFMGRYKVKPASGYVGFPTTCRMGESLGSLGHR